MPLPLLHKMTEQGLVTIARCMHSILPRQAFLERINPIDKNKQNMQIFYIPLQSLVLFLALILNGCATPYYGYSREDWEHLSAKEKQAVQAEYQEIINYRYRQNHEDQFEARKQQVIQHGMGVH